MDFSPLTHLPLPHLIPWSLLSSWNWEKEEQACSRHRASAAGSSPPASPSMPVLCC